MQARQASKEALDMVRALRGTQEIRAVLTWLNLLEQEATERLIKCPRDEHDSHAAEVMTLKALQHMLTAPTFEEQQAKFKVK